MNQTFMFGGDRFDVNSNYALAYEYFGGNLDSSFVNQIIQKTYNYLDRKYKDPKYQETFPSVEEAIIAVAQLQKIKAREVDILIKTFAWHELGQVPLSYVRILQKLAENFQLALVADIWSPKDYWLDELKLSGVLDLFQVTIFSSDLGVVKPSPQPFIKAIASMKAQTQTTLVIGDSIERDLKGAMAANLPCLLIGNRHPLAFASIPNLLAIRFLV